MHLAFFGFALVAATSAPVIGDTLGQVRSAVAMSLDPVMTDDALQRAKVGLHVVRLTDGAELYAHNADALLVPASNVKVLTTAAALKVLSPDYQFPTEFYGALAAAGEVEGDLVVKGYGDPYLVPERVWYLASRLYYLGVREIRGDLVIDDSYFDGSRLADGSEQDRTASAYMAPAGAVSVGFNALLVHVLPGARTGDNAQVLLDPVSRYAAVVGQVRTVEHGRSSVTVDITPGVPSLTGPPRDVVKVAGRIALGDKGRAYWRRITDPPMFAGEVLRGALAQVGISLAGRVRSGVVSPELPKLMDYLSPRLAELIGPLNKYSNNHMAAQVAYALGAQRFGPPGNWDKGRRAIEAFLTDDVRIPAGSYALNNASGLHEVNRFSPRQMVRVLQYMHRQPQLWPEFVNSLAVAAGSGTLQDRMQQTQAAHLLRAKTGTLAGASALSGYVTAKTGETLAFSIIVNGYRNIDRVWAAQDRLGAALASLSFNPPSNSAPASATTVSSVQPLGEGRRP